MAHANDGWRFSSVNFKGTFQNRNSISRTFPPHNRLKSSGSAFYLLHSRSKHVHSRIQTLNTTVSRSSHVHHMITTRSSAAIISGDHQRIRALLVSTHRNRSVRAIRKRHSGHVLFFTSALRLIPSSKTFRTHNRNDLHKAQRASRSTSEKALPLILPSTSNSSFSGGQGLDCSNLNIIKLQSLITNCGMIMTIMIAAAPSPSIAIASSTSLSGTRLKKSPPTGGSACESTEVLTNEFHP